MGRMEARPPRRLLFRLLAGIIVPTVAALGVFGFFAHEVASRALEASSAAGSGRRRRARRRRCCPSSCARSPPGRRGGFAQLRQRQAPAGDRANPAGRAPRARRDSPELESRGDTAGALPLGAHAYELDADRPEIERAARGTPTASPLFVGHDGIPYKRAYAAVGEAGDIAGFIAVEGNADHPAALAAFRRSMLFAGLAALAAVLLLTGGCRAGSRARSRGWRRRRRGSGAATWTPASRSRRATRLACWRRRWRSRARRCEARDERLQMMLAGIAHEVRNPLGGLELYAGLLRDALAAQPERLDEVARIEREVGHLKTVVNEFLEFARRPALRLEAVALRPLFDEIRELAQAPGGAAITVDAADELAVRADVGQLRRALLNLARNAVAAARRNGRVHIAAERAADGQRAHRGPRRRSRRRARAAREDLRAVLHDARKGDRAGPGVRARDRARPRRRCHRVATRPGGGSVFSVRAAARGPESRRHDAPPC